METQWVATEDVRVGDRLACLLSDGQAYPTVTGWTDELLKLEKYDLANVVHRKFTVAGDVPWWLEERDVIGELGEPTLIVKRG